jgi:transcription elongation factor GreA
MPDASEYLTEEKFNELKKELANLKTVRRKEVAENLEYAKSLGDLSENAEYQEARETQANVEDRIKKLEALLQSAVIMSHQASDAVMVGSVVQMEKEGGGSSMTYKMVGSEEANLAEGKLSINSPLGRAMLGRKKGESFDVRTPNGEVKYKITGIE